MVITMKVGIRIDDKRFVIGKKRSDTRNYEGTKNVET